MTTIAYKHGILAADTLCITAADMRAGHTSKIYIGKSYMGGISGAISDGVLFRMWLEKGDLQGKPPPFAEVLKAIVVDRDHITYFMSKAGVLVPVDMGCAASGTGEEMAMGAMMAGASAKQAVQIAIGLDVYSGGDVQTLEFGK